VTVQDPTDKKFAYATTMGACQHGFEDGEKIFSDETMLCLD